jgi:stearoyl-CoA desaturase (delta-9 desaturase)
MTADHLVEGTTVRAARKRLPYPIMVDPRRLVWVHAAWVIAYHALALLAFVPWFFSWTGVIVGLVSAFAFSLFGIAIGYHRLLTHRGFTCPKWLEHYFAIMGLCCLQDTPARWVAQHRWHHQHADHQPDPHSPLVTAFWAHMGWAITENKELSNLGVYDRYARDILRDRFYLWIECRQGQLKVVLASWLIYFAAGFVPGLLLGWPLAEAAQFGLSLLVWGVFVRTVITWHQTWSVNSITHLWGYRSYATDDDSRNNFWVAILTHGEGWHNNHHADPRSVNQWHRWWEIDVAYLTIRLFAMLGLAHNLCEPGAHLARADGDGAAPVKIEPPQA